MISVILVEFNNGRLTLEAVRSLRAHNAGPFEVLIVDNGSEDGSPDLIQRELEDVRLIVNRHNEGFGSANNRAAAEAVGEILLFLNNDTLSITDFINRAERKFHSDPFLGVLGPKLLFPDHTFQLSAGALPTFWNEMLDKAVYAAERRNISIVRRAAESSYARQQEVGWVTGAALFIRKDLFRQIGGFDPSMFMYFEDKDLCARAAATGARVVYDPSISLIHLKGGSSGGSARLKAHTAYRRSQVRYYERHRPRYEHRLLQLYLRLTGRFPND